MTSPKHNNIFSLRLFLAGLKPIGRPTFLITLGTIMLGGLALWQYVQNPEWLGVITEQPPPEPNLLPVPANPSNVPTSPTSQEKPENLPALDQQNSLPVIPSNSGQNNPLGTNMNLDVLSPLTQPLKNATGKPNANNQTSQLPNLFTPLLPKVAPPTTNPSVPVQSLPKFEPAEVRDNPLQRAIEQETSQPSPSTVQTQIPTVTRNNNLPQTNQLPSYNNTLPNQVNSIPSATVNNNYGTQLPQNQYYPPNNNYNTQVPVQPYQNPVYNYGTQPQPIQSYPSLNNSNAVMPSRGTNPSMNQINPSANGVITPQIQPSLSGSFYR